MSFQSSKINAETVLHFPGGVATAQVPRSEVLSSQQVLCSQGASATAEPLLPVLIVLHQETSTPGRVGNALRALGHRLDIRRPRFGDALPETLDQHAGAELLAAGDDFPVQAFQSGHAFGFQFHPDVTWAMMHCWTTRGYDRMDAP